MENVFTDSDIKEQEIKKESSIDFKMVTFTLAGKDYGIDIMKVKEMEMYRVYHIFLTHTL